MKMKDLREAVEALSNVPDDVEIVGEINSGIHLSKASLTFEVAGMDEKDKHCEPEYGETVLLVRVLI